MVKLIAVLALFVGVIASQTISIKNLAGEPSEFADHKLPDPLSGAQIQRSTFEPIWITSKTINVNLPEDILYQEAIYVDSEKLFQLSFSSPYAAEVQISLLDPNGNNVDLSNEISGQFPVGDCGATVPESSWSFKGLIVGKYTFIIKAIGSNKLTKQTVSDDETPFGYIFTLNDSPIIMIGHLSTYNLQQGENVGVVAMVVEAKSTMSREEILQLEAKKDIVTSAILAVELPDGTEEDLTMHDDGLHMDGAANDGIYGATLPASEIGNYKASATLIGYDEKGVYFKRTTEHVIASVPRSFELTGDAIGVMTDSEHLTISLNVELEGDNAPEFFNVYSEVYAKDSVGKEVAVCWIGGMTTLQTSFVPSVQVVLDTKWLNLAGVKLPITLKNTVVQEAGTFVVISSAAEISVKTAGDIVLTDTKVTQITEEMRQGVKPESLRVAARSADAGALILVHGYCSSTNPWSTHKSEFTNAYYFLNPSASLTNDAFARLVVNFANSNGLSAYSLIGHSQGGSVATHILNFYWSGLDNVSGGRKIQSLGTPYKGSTLAGSAANLGKIFGIGCGSNYDLSLDGAAMWLPTISTATRSKVYFYTTTYKQGTFFGDYCNLAANAILQWPNDGTCETAYASLPSGNNLGNTQKQCHTSGMAYMAQYDDVTRNVAMNNAAAR